MEFILLAWEMSEQRTGPFQECNEQIADEFRMTDVHRTNRLCDDSTLMMLA
jgi:hypothetical protein